MTVETAVDRGPPGRRLLRVAVVTETYPPEVNGAALTLARVVEGLRVRRHDLQLIRPRQHPDELAQRDERFQELLVRGLPVPRYPMLKMGLPARQTLLDSWTAQRPHIVHIATEGPLGWSALRAATHLNLPVCSDFRTNFHAYSRHYGVGWLQQPIMAYLRAFHNGTQRTMVPTEALRRELSRLRFRNLSVVTRGVDTALFDPDRRSDELRHAWGATPRTSVALYVGRLAPEKNLGMLVSAFEAMKQVNPDLKLVLVGDGPSRRELQARCPDAVFAGVRSGPDLAAHYASGDVFLFPSLTETFGNVTLEAMASGLAVLAYDHAGAAQLICNGENGLLAPLDGADAFVPLAVRLAEEHDTAARALALRARHTATASSWERIVEQVEAVFMAEIADAERPQDGTVQHVGATVP
jgi:glycosyltransferase involved in cell wall biosynthesis